MTNMHRSTNGMCFVAEKSLYRHFIFVAASFNQGFIKLQKRPKFRSFLLSIDKRKVVDMPETVTKVTGSQHWHKRAAVRCAPISERPNALRAFHAISQSSNTTMASEFPETDTTTRNSDLEFSTEASVQEYLSGLSVEQKAKLKESCGKFLSLSQSQRGREFLRSLPPEPLDALLNPNAKWHKIPDDLFSDSTTAHK